MKTAELIGEGNIILEVAAMVKRRKESLSDYATAHEAYAILKDKQETLEKHIDFNKIMKEFWGAVKEGNTEAIIAYADRLETCARNVASAAIELAAYADMATRI